ncbi:hypothetical protein C2G38_2181144 [Gigaspora rosea]|uniref:Uncharacterized protein n=1 Tax=Gigaspora rosea TaxID=44941 RepID=A0A397VCZ9_9GLOM|nr:hypothetical protein C2G38_2181144 [Gigaspora rosea]
MSIAEPRSKLITYPNILNIGVIDNIDMKDATFHYGNIYDVTRVTAHATLRMIFQFQYSELANLNDEPLENQNLFGINFTIEQWQRKIDTIFNELISCGQEFNIEHVDSAIKKYIDSAPFVSPPNIIILEPGEANEHVHMAANMFLEDFEYMENSVLNLACDEAIYRRMNDYENKNQIVHCILEQWHTNKAMCSALISGFSGYGLFGLVSYFGVRFLDKLEQIADYRAIFRVLELIWIAVRVAIHLYIQDEQISINDIPIGNNKLLKVWYNFYQWAGYLKLHKLGIRMANFNLQMNRLLAFASLFPATRKIRYTESVARFLLDLQRNPQFLQTLEQYPQLI